MALPAGTRLGPYEVVAQIGTGGMGEVYKARDPRLDRWVAIKVLPPGLAEDASFMARFQREAKAVAALAHPNLVGIHDFNREGERAYAVMEYLEGENLADCLSRGPLPVRKAVSFAHQCALGLAAAHGKGIVHRDLKPANIWVTREGRIKVLDFGLAKVQGAPAGSDPSATEAMAIAPLTEHGMVLGTAGYMSPEQVRGEPADARSDVFSFGVVLFEMLTGQRAFKGDTPIQTMNAILEAEPPELRVAKGHLPPALERLVLHCLEKHPANRFQSMGDLAYALDNLSSLTEASGGFLTPFASRNRATTRAWAAVGALALAGVGWGGWTAHRPATARVEFTPLTFASAPVWNARFTRDGNSVVYTRGGLTARDCSILTLTVDNPLPRPVLEADNALLALSRTNEMATISGLQNAQGRAETFVGILGRAPVGGAKPRSLSRQVVSAAWTPDGSALAVVRDMGGAGMQVEFPEGKVLQRMEGGWFSHLRFSPDGSRLAVCGHPVLGDDMGFLMVLDAKTGEARKLSGPWEAIRGTAWTRDGGEIWFTAGNTVNRELMAVDLGGRRRNLVTAPTDLNLEDIAEDGRVLLISGDTMLRVFRYDLGAKLPADLTLRNYSIIRGSSPDGKFVVLDDEAASGSPPYPLFLVAGDGAMPTPLGLGTAAIPSADGKRVLIVRGDPGAPKAALMTLETGVEEPVSMEGISFRSLTFSLTSRDEGVVLQPPGKSPAHLWKIAKGKAPVPVGPDLPSDTQNFILADPEGHRAIVFGPRNQVGWADLDHAQGSVTPVKGLDEKDRVVGTPLDGTNLFVTRDPILPAAVERLDFVNGRRQPYLRVEAPGIHAATGTGALSADGKRWLGLNRQLTAQLYVVKGLK